MALIYCPSEPILLLNLPRKSTSAPTLAAGENQREYRGIIMFLNILLACSLTLVKGDSFGAQNKYVCFISNDHDKVAKNSLFAAPCTHYVMPYIDIRISDNTFDFKQQFDEETLINELIQRNITARIYLSVKIQDSSKSLKHPKALNSFEDFYENWQQKYNLSGLVFRNGIKNRETVIHVVGYLRRIMDERSHELYLQGEGLIKDYYKKDFLYEFFNGVMVVYTQYDGYYGFIPPLIKSFGSFKSMLEISKSWLNEGFKLKNQFGEISFTSMVYEKASPTTSDDVFSTNYISQKYLNLQTACAEMKNFNWKSSKKTKLNFGDNATHIMIMEDVTAVKTKASILQKNKMGGFFIRYLNEDSAQILNCAKSSYPLTNAAVGAFSSITPINYYRSHTLPERSKSLEPLLS